MIDVACCQAGLIGIFNYVNMLGLPLVSVDCLSTECQKWQS
jgi:hypothetical protein